MVLTDKLTSDVEQRGQKQTHTYGMRQMIDTVLQIRRKRIGYLAVGAGKYTSLAKNKSDFFPKFIKIKTHMN